MSEIKDQLKEKASNVSVDSIKALSTKTKAIIGGSALVVLGLIFSGGSDAVSLNDVKARFDPTDSIEDQCLVIVNVEYNLRSLMYYKSESLEDIQAAYKEVLARKTTPKTRAEFNYWKSITGASYMIDKRYETAEKGKGKLPDSEQRDKAQEKCVSKFDK